MEREKMKEENKPKTTTEEQKKTETTTEILCPKAGTATSSPFVTTANPIFQCCWSLKRDDYSEYTIEVVSKSSRGISHNARLDDPEQVKRSSRLKWAHICEASGWGCAVVITKIASVSSLLTASGFY
jgi:hypothetical protein